MYLDPISNEESLGVILFRYNKAYCVYCYQDLNLYFILDSMITYAKFMTTHEVYNTLLNKPNVIKIKDLFFKLINASNDL